MVDEPIDLDHLAQYTAGDKALELDLLLEFLSNAESYVAGIVDAPGSEAAQVAAHTLKGVASGVGAFDLAAVAGEAEKLEGHKRGEILLRLDAELERLRLFLAAMDH
jgi:HPt (histidine-containing phosphotransfer) domain-containing protein